MRVALVAPLVSPIDERAPQLGGAQAVVADLACGLAADGHEVTLLAASGSFVSGVRTPDLGIDADRLVPVVLDGPRPRADDGAQRDAFDRVRAWVDTHAGAIDVVHAHAYDAPAFDALDDPARRVVHTLHLPPIDPTVVRAALASPAAKATVSRANAAAWEKRGVGVRHVIANGVDVDAVPLGSGRGGYLLAAGRIAPEKGFDIAARVAGLLHIPLWVAGDVYDPSAREAIDPGGVLFLGPLARADLFRVMGDALAVLMPVTWDEPFGLVAIEAMATGTPVVAYGRGGLVEVIEDGETGFLVEPHDERSFVDAASRVRSIDRAACRAHVAANFSLGRMAAAHAAMYAAL